MTQWLQGTLISVAVVVICLWALVVWTDPGDVEE